MPLFHQLHQLSITVDDVVFDLIRCDLGEEFAGAIDFAFFDLPQLHRRHGALRFGDEVDVFNFAFFEGNAQSGL